MSRSCDILLVDDNISDVKLALHALGEQSQSGKVAVVRDGQEALDFIFRRGKYTERMCSLPKFVLLDLKLPKVNGFEVLQALKTDISTQAIPVIVFSSSNQECDLRESYRLGANSYVQKPVDFDAFTELIARIKQYWLSVNNVPPLLADARPTTGRAEVNDDLGPQQS